VLDVLVGLIGHVSCVPGRLRVFAGLKVARLWREEAAGEPRPECGCFAAMPRDPVRPGPVCDGMGAVDG
jgi:hypothetical protein